MKEKLTKEERIKNLIPKVREILGEDFVAESPICSCATYFSAEEFAKVLVEVNISYDAEDDEGLLEAYK